MLFKVILIDFDGTIANSLPVLFTVYSNIVEDLGGIPSKKEFEDLNGPSLAEIAAILLKRYPSKMHNKELLNLYQETLREAYNGLTPFPGTKDFLRKAMTLNFRMGIVTSAYRRLVVDFLEKYELNSYFSGIYTSDNVERAKPNPDLYTYALKMMKIESKDCVVIEDSNHGLKSAINAGIECRWQIHVAKSNLAIPIKSWSEATSRLDSLLPRGKAHLP